MESLAYDLVPVILIFVLGFILKLLGILKQEHGDVFMKVVFYLSLPALVILSLTRIELTKELAWLPLISFTIIMIQFLLSFITGKVMKLDRPTHGVLMVGTMIMNIGFALPFVIAAYGDEGLALLSIFDFSNAVLAFTLVYYIACRYGEYGNSSGLLIKKFIYVSVFGAEEMKHLKAIQAKLKFEEELKNSGLDYTIVYPNGFFSDMLEYLEMAKKGRGYVFGKGDNKINPIHGRDLAEVCVNAAASNDKTIDVGGPEVFTHNEILGLAFNTVGKKTKISKVPLWIKDALLKFLKTFTSVKTYGPLEFFMTVLSKDMVAPSAGSRKLEDYFEESR